MSSASQPATENIVSPRKALLPAVCLFALLVTSAALELRHLSSLGDSRVWLELRVGDWIRQHHAFPHTGISSQLSAQKWDDPNWGSQLLLSWLNGFLGLRAIPLWTILWRVLFAGSLFCLGGGRRGQPWRGLALAASASFILFHNPTQGLLLNGVLLTMALVLLSGDTLARSSTYAVPVLLCVWANLDWHFVVGVVAVVAYSIARTIEDRSTLRESLLLATTAVVAPMISPYGWRTYTVAWERWFGAGWQNWLGYTGKAFPDDMKAMDFRAPQHFALLLLAMLACLAIGRTKGRPYWLASLLLGTLVLAFCFQTEAWAIVTISVAVLGGPLEAGIAQRTWRAAFVAIAGGVAISLLLVTRIPGDPALREKVAESFPLHACDYVAQRHLPGPIYNDLHWGNFLAWCLPEHEVSSDSRMELYGDAQVQATMQVSRGEISKPKDPLYLPSRTLIVSTQNAIIHGPELFADPKVKETALAGFKIVYRDEQAVVLTQTE